MTIGQSRAISIVSAGAAGGTSLAALESDHGKCQGVTFDGSAVTAIERSGSDREARHFEASPSLLGLVGGGLTLAPGVRVVPCLRHPADCCIEGAGASLFAATRGAPGLRHTVYPGLPGAWAALIEGAARGGGQ